MQKVQILNGTPEATFKLTVPDVAGRFALERILRRNLITNGDMELDANWTDYGTPAVEQRDATKLLTGNYSRLFTPNAANEGTQSDPFTTITGVRYFYTVWVYPDDGTIVSIILRQGDNLADLYNEIHSGLTQDAWNEIEIEVTELGGGAGAYLVVHSGAQTSGDFYVTNVYASRSVHPSQHSGRKASHALITVDTNDIRWAVGGAEPTAVAGTGIGHLVTIPVAGIGSLTTFELRNFDAIKSFRYINNVAAAAGHLQVTLSF